MRSAGCLSPGWLGVAVGLGGIALPLLVAGLAGGLASLLGCEVNEGGVGVCMVGETDLMPLLTAMLIFGWLIVIAPFWAVLLLLSIGWLAYERWREAEWAEEE